MNVSVCIHNAHYTISSFPCLYQKQFILMSNHHKRLRFIYNNVCPFLLPPTNTYPSPAIVGAGWSDGPVGWRFMPCRNPPLLIDTHHSRRFYVAQCDVFLLPPSLMFIQYLQVYVFIRAMENAVLESV